MALFKTIKQNKQITDKGNLQQYSWDWKENTCSITVNKIQSPFEIVK